MGKTYTNYPILVQLGRLEIQFIVLDFPRAGSRSFECANLGQHAQGSRTTFLRHAHAPRPPLFCNCVLDYARREKARREKRRGKRICLLRPLDCTKDAGHDDARANFNCRAAMQPQLFSSSTVLSLMGYKHEHESCQEDMTNRARNAIRAGAPQVKCGCFCFSPCTRAIVSRIIARCDPPVCVKRWPSVDQRVCHCNSTRFVYFAQFC